MSDESYFRRLGTFTVLDRLEECELATQIEIGVLAREQLSHATPGVWHEDLTELAALGGRAMQRLVQCNLRLVVSVARRYLDRNVPLDDLIQEGNLGLIRAIHGFDCRRGFRFSTYAVPWIRDYIERGIASHSTVIRIPQHQLAKLRAARQLEHEIVAFEGRAPSLAELGDYLSMSPEKVQSLLDVGRPVVSLQAPIGETGFELGDVIADASAAGPLDLAIEREELSALRDAISELEPGARHSVITAFMLGTVSNSQKPGARLTEELSMALAELRDRMTG